jgi:hypothetical protein
MTDLTPNDLSHLSDEKFNALCPQGFHATDDFEPDNLTPEEHNALVLISDHAIAPPLSPAAQAVMDAFRAEWPDEALKQDCKWLAAALRAVADQVVPKPIRLPRNSYAEGAYDQRIIDHQQLRAIATELEGHQ